jgi:hypothetical protein
MSGCLHALTCPWASHPTCHCCHTPSTSHGQGKAATHVTAAAARSTVDNKADLLDLRASIHTYYYYYYYIRAYGTCWCPTHILLAANKQWLIGPGMSLAAGALLTLLLLLLLFSTAGRVCHEPHALQPCCFRPKPPSSSNLRSSCAAAAAAAVAAAVRTMPAKTC